MGNFSPTQTRPRALKQRGIGMLQLLVILGALMALVVGLSYKTSDYFAKSQALDSDALLRLADNQLRQYIVANGRLPCPDLHVPATGLESSGCTSSDQKGYLPYKTLGMVESNYVYGEVPMLYGVYNDGPINFASSAQIFFPTYRDKSNTSINVSTTRNTFDFCASLTALKAGGGATGLSVNGEYKAVFALALPGKANRDGLAAGWSGGPSVNDQYDGLNATNSKQFELPQKPVGPVYDDRTHFRAADDMYDYLRCESMNSSVSLLAEAVTIQKEVEDFADGNSEDATKGLVMNAVGIAIATWELVQTVGDIAEAAEQIGIAAGLLATVSATCPLPPWVTCALIPVYAAALSSASVGQGLAIGAAVAAGIGLGLNITATVLYADLKARTSTTPTEPVQSVSGISAARLLELKNTYNTSKATAQTKFNLVVPATAPNVSGLNTTQLNAAGALTTNINGVVDTTLQTVLANNLSGLSMTCVAGKTACEAAGYIERLVPQKDGSGNIVMNGNNPVMTPIYTKDGLSGTFTPGVKPALDNYYGAIAQSGASSQLPNSPAIQAVTDANATLAAAPVVDPATALAASNALVVKYNALLAATAAFDAKNLAYRQALALEAAKLAALNALTAPDGTALANAEAAKNAASTGYTYAVNLGARAASCDTDAEYAAGGSACSAVNEFTNRATQGGQTAYARIDWYNTQVYQNSPNETCAVTVAEQNSIACALGVSNTANAAYQTALTAYNNLNGPYQAALTAYNNAVSARQTAEGERTTALGNLRTAMGNGSWNYTGDTTLCGGGSTSTSSCGWMANTPGSAAAGNASGAASSWTAAATGSTTVNGYLTAYDNYEDALAWQKLKDAANNAAASAWSDRNGYKTALCATKSPSVTWLGGTSRSGDNPSAWDTSEALPSAAWSGTGTTIATNVSVSGLSCAGSASARDNTTDSTAARNAEILKYCTTVATKDPAMCALYTSTPARSAIRGAKNIVDALILKGVVQ